MKKIIKLVSSFAHKDTSNIFSNVLISNGMITAQNGIYGISINMSSDVNFCCNAEKLSRAFALCDESNMKLSIKNERVYISSGRFKSNIPLSPIESYPSISVPDNSFDIQSDILDQMLSISQFTDPNDVRIALQGVELTDGFINATNGHMAVKKAIDCLDGIDNLVIPSKSIIAMSKINKPITLIAAENKMVFFSFEDGFVFTKTIDQRMPDIGRILSEMKNPIDTKLIKDPIISLAPLCEGDKVILLGDEIKTRNDDASMGGFALPDCAFNVDYLVKIFDVAEKIDFTPYPAACPFEGNGIVGAVVGVKL